MPGSAICGESAEFALVMGPGTAEMGLATDCCAASRTVERANALQGRTIHGQESLVHPGRCSWRCSDLAVTARVLRLRSDRAVGLAATLREPDAGMTLKRARIDLTAPVLWVTCYTNVRASGGGA
ncbi:hypothetical protein C8Q77DRAFT_1073575 [Trametes polyzona]|nr:hypothetical protein C8Q77DRAFT_1073575 [Trametes polyzona]